MMTHTGLLLMPMRMPWLQAVFLEVGGCPKVDVVQDFNVTAFLGDWYTQYTSPYWFQSQGGNSINTFLA